jgi:uncharacterized membrane protein YkvA (DUF1232 family)
MVWWQVVVAVALGLLLVWLVLAMGLLVAGRQDARRTDLRAVLRLVPDVVRLLRRLSRDPALPRGVRVRLVLLLVYLVLPIDLVPDFIPVVGYADDAIIVALAIRSVVRAAGPEALDRHWPGTPVGLRAVRRLARVSD